MNNYDVIFKKLEEINIKQANQKVKILTITNSKNINELSKLSYEIKNPQPSTYSFS